MTDKQRKYYIRKYRHLSLHFGYKGWDDLILMAAVLLDKEWPSWMPNWLKRLNNRMMYANGGESLVRVTKFHYSRFKKLLPFIKDYPRFMQIKEKFGSLRLYTTHSEPDQFNNLETLSYITCEICGYNSSGVVKTKGWIYNCCEKCAKQYYPDSEWKQTKLTTTGRSTEISH